MIHALAIALFAVLAEPDYSAWSVLLHKYYDPAKGMNYAALKAFFGSNMVRTIEAGPLHVAPEDTFKAMFGEDS